jgi:1-phosphofructokinase family hexose kinase
MIYTVTLNPALDRELTVPALAFNDVLRASATRSDVGGKGFNVSRMLASLGSASVALGFAGGHTGAMLRDGLHALGIETDFVQITGETRTNISIVSDRDGQHIKVNEPGPTISAEEQAQLRARLRARIEPGDWCVLAGSVPPGVPPTIYADLIADIHRAGGRAILDTSGDALQHGVAAQPFLVKPNIAEISALTGMTIESMHDAFAAAQRLERIDMVVVSMGKAGALLAQNGQGWTATSPPIHERNPIGAGDSMVGGLVWALSHGYAPSEALRWGVACGAATARLPGTAVGSAADVQREAANVSVNRIGFSPR